jgi:hypothetical protein
MDDFAGALNLLEKILYDKLNEKSLLITSIQTEQKHREEERLKKEAEEKRKKEEAE